jgi:hypothetical protein
MSESKYATYKPPEISDFNLPKIITIGFSTLYKNARFSVDNEVVYGKYGGLGDKRAKFWILRTGLEKSLNKNLELRCGLIFPLIAETSTLGNIRNDLPHPKFGGAIGIGFNFDHVRLDISAYGDLAKSYVEQSKYRKAAASLTFIL